MESVEDLKMENYKLQADLIQAKDMYFERSRELDEKNNELKRKNDENKEFQKIIVELREEISAVRKSLSKAAYLHFPVNENLTRNLHANQSESMLKNDENKELKRTIEELRKEISSLKSEKETLKNELCAKENEIRLGVKKSLVSESSVKKEITTENTSVLIMGGWNLNTIYLLDSKAQSWKKLNITLPVAMHTFGAALVNNEIYIFGGVSGPTCHQNCYKLQSDGTWMELASLNEKRFGISNSSVVYFGEIWVIGGSSGNQHLKSVEKYNISQNKWIQMPEMNQEKCHAAAAVFKNKIIVTGGNNSISKTLNSVELFDPELQQWILFCDIPIQIYCHSMTITGSILTIYGGRSDSKSVWEMDIEDSEKKWTKKQDLKYARKLFGVAKLSNGIVAFGGDGTDTTEIFNGNNWIDGSKLPQELSYFAFTPIPRSFEEFLIKKFT